MKNLDLFSGLLIAALCGSSASGQVITDEFDEHYSYLELGTVVGVPVNYGGLTTKLGDPLTLILGGAANSSVGQLYAVPLVRDADGHIVGIGVASYFAEANYNDGGVVYGPGGVLFCSRWPVNALGQTRPGSTMTDKIIDLYQFGVEYSHAALNFVPAGFPGAGRMKIVSWSGGQWSDVVLAPDGFGLFDIVSVASVATSRLTGGPEGFAYVAPGSPLISVPSLLVSEYSAGAVSLFEIDANADPILGTRRLLLEGLTGAEGAFVDPITGDFVFSTFGGYNRLAVVRGFVPSPELGSCCLGRCNCEVLTAAQCFASGGVFLGSATDCGEALGCAPACPCDWNNADGLDSQDFFDFLSDFFDGVADFNCDGERDSQDYFEFNDCFFGGICGA